jgi:hypothetical protein
MSLFTSNSLWIQTHPLLLSYTMNYVWRGILLWIKVDPLRLDLRCVRLYDMGPGCLIARTDEKRHSALLIVGNDVHIAWYYLLCAFNAYAAIGATFIFEN